MYIRQSMPTGMGLEAIVDPVDYLNARYVSGTTRRVQRSVASHRIQPMRIRRIPPLFPPSMWNVHDTTLTNTDRTNKLRESWNSLRQPRRSAPPVTENALHQDEALATTDI